MLEGYPVMTGSISAQNCRSKAKRLQQPSICDCRFISTDGGPRRLRASQQGLREEPSTWWLNIQEGLCGYPSRDVIFLNVYSTNPICLHLPAKVEWKWRAGRYRFTRASRDGLSIRRESVHWVGLQKCAKVSSFSITDIFKIKMTFFYKIVSASLRC